MASSPLTDEDGDLPVNAKGGLERLVASLDELNECGHDVHVRVRVTVQEEAVRHACPGFEIKQKHGAEEVEREGGTEERGFICGREHVLYCWCVGSGASPL